MLLSLNNITINKEFLINIKNNNEHNKIIIDYYKQYNNEMRLSKIERKIENISNCNKMFMIDKYEIQKVKDFKKTNLCKDKFCNNCKKVKQASRMSKYVPQLSKFDDLYMLTLTVPNVSGYELRKTIKTMFHSFTRLIEYFKLKEKIKGVEFEHFNYAGAIRSLEITFKNDEYHPHLHCILYLPHYNEKEKHNINEYSYSYGKLINKFSDDEILIQKVWYLLNNKIKVNKKNILELSQGYSCKLDKLKENDFIEVFKYMTKSTDEDNNIMSYENFKILYESLLNVRQIQGYGVFYNFNDDNNEDEVNKIYDEIITQLQLNENAISLIENLNDLILDNDYKLISRKKIYEYLRLI